jgi:hypothetical protein
MIFPYRNHQSGEPLELEAKQTEKEIAGVKTRKYKFVPFIGMLKGKFPPTGWSNAPSDDIISHVIFNLVEFGKWGNEGDADKTRE